MTVLTAVVTVLTALLFLAAARVKFTEDAQAMETRDRMGIAPGAFRLIGMCEVAGAVGAVVGLFVPFLGIAALTGLVLVSLGACATQVKLRNALAEERPAILALVLSVGALALQLAAM